ncbi:hypothetical protein COCON_G00025850 [Conger conger]|uniref:C2H2-type domain-containing protein n=1 Tax=Conger conger TaxID=82655 RepID=A0A9Q1DXM5_CONCO|nr:hypothetical protein COCON_G00025850 [Conger conger]
MEPGESSPSRWDPPSLVTVPLDPLSSSPQNPESPTHLHSTLQSSCSPAVRGEHTDSGGPWDGNGEGTGDSSSRTGSGGTAQRSPRPSAFPSSLAWDSDSEKETLDEEELQHFSNPHGLAAHSPGSPALGHRQESADSEGDKAPEKLQHLTPERDPASPGDGQDHGGASTQADEPKTAQPRSPDSEENGDRELTEKTSPEPLSSEAKPKDGCRREEGGRDGQRGREEGPVLDVYSFPGDSDTESPPPAPWAHCTFTQRRKRKRALLKPFSGLGSQQGLPLGSWKRPKSSPLKAREDTLRAAERENPREEDELCEEVFTCVECSIYFNKQVHLREHMQQHWQGEEGRGRDGDGAGRFQCAECGWELEDGPALAEHRRQHQDSRQKILEEISKLNEGGKGELGAAAETAEAVSAPPRLRCPKCKFGTDSSRVYVEHAKMHIKERNSQRSRGQGPQPLLGPAGLYRPSTSTSPSPAASPSPLSCDLCSFQASSHSALQEHLLLSHPSWPSAWEEEEEEGCPGTSRDFLNPTLPPLRPGEEPFPPRGRGTPGTGKAGLHVGTAVKGARPYLPQTRLSPPPSVAPGAGPRRRDVAFKSIGNRRARRGGEWREALVLRPSPLPSETGGAQTRDQNMDQVPQKDQQLDADLDSKEVPALALQLKRSFSDGLRGASESLGLTAGQQIQLRHMLPLVLIEPFHFIPRAPSPVPGFGERVRAAGNFRPFLKDNLACPVVKEDDEEEENDEHNDEDDDENLFLSEEDVGEEAGMLKNIERKCPYCPDRFHNGIGLANHVRGHLNRVGVSYNVRHFISPEEVNAIERKFSYQKKRKKVANFDPDTFSLMRCEFCSAGFDTRAGLSSHARAHLRDFGITNWEVTVSPINILRELFSSRPDLVLPTAPPRSPPVDADSEDEDEELGLGRAVDSTLSSLASTPPPPVAETQAELSGTSGPESGTLLLLNGVQEDKMPTVEGVATGSGRKSVVPSDSGNKRMDTASPRDEPDTKATGLLQCEVCGAPFETRRGLSSHAPPPEPEPTRDIRCEFCGEYFENRKGLSSHARSHLRQLGITEWSVNGSPIDTLRELMRKKGTPPAGQVKKEPGLGGSPTWEELGYLSPKFSRKSPVSMLHSGSRLLKQGLGAASLSLSPLGAGKGGGYLGSSPLGKRPLSDEGQSSDRPSPKTFSPPPLDFSFKGKSSPEKYGASHSASDASCELCGFYFENRKALASHARAHLRQFGVTEWCVNGSPIETLSAWMRSKPHKVAEMHRRYMQGDRPFPKKKSGSSPSPSADLERISPGVSRPLSSQRPSLGLPQGRRAGREVTGGTWGASREGGSLQQSPGASRQPALPHSQVARSELNVRSPRGFERRPPKHLSHSESGERETGPPQPPRTGTIPALVPKPPSTPLVKLVGKVYSLKCRFCEVEFQGPLSVQEDWVRHLQQHILDLNFNKPAPPSTPTPEDTPAPEDMPTPCGGVNRVGTAPQPRPIMGLISNDMKEAILIKSSFIEVRSSHGQAPAVLSPAARASCGT